jgi:signal peptidase I
MEPGAKNIRLSDWLLIALVGRSPKRTMVRIVFLVAAVILVRTFVLINIKVIGPSMLPTYQENGINFVNALAYIRSQPRRGDVVAIRYSGRSIMLMKRIVGLPGETVQFHNGRLLINGEPLEVPYVKFNCDWESEPRTLAADCYYFVGDNRSMPEVNHTEGVASRNRIVGKILLCKNLFASSPPQR